MTFLRSVRGYIISERMRNDGIREVSIFVTRDILNFYGRRRQNIRQNIEQNIFIPLSAWTNVCFRTLQTVDLSQNILLSSSLKGKEYILYEDILYLFTLLSFYGCCFVSNGVY
jgi:hypothetical protein